MGSGRILFLAIGTGLDVRFFPPGRQIVGIDISDRMLEKARGRCEAYDGKIELQAMDVHDMPFPDHSFDQVFTSCTFCSVPRPVDGLKALRRVLVPGRRAPHVRAHRKSLFPLQFDAEPDDLALQPLRPGHEPRHGHEREDRGFTVREVNHVYLDVVKTISATA